MGQENSQSQSNIQSNINKKEVNSSQLKTHQPLAAYTTEITYYQFNQIITAKAKHILQDFKEKTLQQPENYEPSPFSSESFYKIKSYDVYYCGEWKEGIPHGKGQAVLQDGSYFKGFFQAGKANGPECIYAAANGGYYKGPIVNNVRVGKGIFIHRQYSYSGEWKENMPWGFGIEKYPNGDEYQGQFVNGQKSGIGDYQWKEGPYYRYKGEFKDNYINGKGEIFLRNGDQIAGRFNCEQNIDIKNVTMVTKQYTFRGSLSDFKPVGEFVITNNEGEITINDISNGVTGEMTSKDRETFYLFQGKQLIYLEKNYNLPQIRLILNAIQEGYENVHRHSQAMKNIQAGLKNYIVEWWSQKTVKKGLLVAQICGRKIMVRKKLNQQ